MSVFPRDLRVSIVGQELSLTYFEGLLIDNGTADVGAFSAGNALGVMECELTIFKDFITNKTAQILVWSWDLNQPDTSECASIDYSSGRWKTEQCGAVSHSFACRSNDDAHTWKISSSSSLRDVDPSTVCPAGYSFSTPRTALENHLVIESMKQANIHENVWISMNKYPNGTWSTVPTIYAADEDKTESDATRIICSTLFLFAATCILFIM